MSKNYSDLGKIILKALGENGWSISELAKESELSRQFISNVMKGTTSPTQRSLDKIRKALGKSNSFFLSENNENVINENNGIVHISELKDYRELIMRRLDKIEATNKNIETSITSLNKNFKLFLIKNKKHSKS